MRDRGGGSGERGARRRCVQKTPTNVGTFIHSGPRRRPPLKSRLLVCCHRPHSTPRSRYRNRRKNTFTLHAHTPGPVQTHSHPHTFMTATSSEGLTSHLSSYTGSTGWAPTTAATAGRDSHVTFIYSWINKRRAQPKRPTQRPTQIGFRLRILMPPLSSPLSSPWKQWAKDGPGFHCALRIGIARWVRQHARLHDGRQTRACRARLLRAGACGPPARRDRLLNTQIQVAATTPSNLIIHIQPSSPQPASPGRPHWQPF